MKPSERVFRVLDALAWGVSDVAEKWPSRGLRFIGIFFGMATFILTIPIQLPLMVVMTVCEMWESTE